jgi:type IV secretory pathway VirB6-like protein
MFRISNVLKTLVSKQQPYHCQKKENVHYIQIFGTHILLDATYTLLDG